jgi:hypothetical protein
MVAAWNRLDVWVVEKYKYENVVALCAAKHSRRE